MSAGEEEREWVAVSDWENPLTDEAMDEAASMAIEGTLISAAGSKAGAVGERLEWWMVEMILGITTVDNSAEGRAEERMGVSGRSRTVGLGDRWF